MLASWGGQVVKNSLLDRKALQNDKHQLPGTERKVFVGVKVIYCLPPQSVTDRQAVTNCNHTVICLSKIYNTSWIYTAKFKINSPSIQPSIHWLPRLSHGGSSLRRDAKTSRGWECRVEVISSASLACLGVYIWLEMPKLCPTRNRHLVYARHCHEQTLGWPPTNRSSFWYLMSCAFGL